MDEALVRFLADTGCRIGAACSLEVGAINMDQCNALVHEKGGRFVRVFFTPPTRKGLSAWIRQRPACEHDFVFISRLGNPLAPRVARQHLTRVGEAAGVEHVYPCRFRPTVGRRWALAGVPLTATARKLNHQNPHTTARYYQNMDEDDVRRFTDELGFDQAADA